VRDAGWGPFTFANGYERNMLTKGLHVVPSPLINNSILLATTAIESNDIWAAGFIGGGSDVTLAEHFDGTSWSVVTTPSISNAQFAGVAAAASNDVWAVGSKGSPTSQPLIEHWNGTTWSEVSSPRLKDGGFLSGVTTVSSNNAWAVGTAINSSTSLVEHWDGTSWSIVSSSAFTGGGGGAAVSADSSNDVWAVGGATTLNWNGTSWIRVSAVGTVGLNAVTAISPTNVWAVGIQSHRHGIPVIEHWDGTSWSIVSSPNPNPNVTSSLSGVATISANDIWAAGNDAGWFSEHWDGTSWSIINSPSGGELFGATALSDGIVVAVGSAGSSGLIVSNSTSVPASAAMAGTRPAAPIPIMPAPVDAALLDQFFATAGKGDQPLSFARQSSATDEPVAIGDGDVLPEGPWLLDGLDRSP
jgi:hypothetical protein